MSQSQEITSVPLVDQMPMLYGDERALDTREIVDDLFEDSDRVAHSIMSAIHAKAMTGVEWVKNNETGIYRAPTAEELAERKAQAEAAEAEKWRKAAANGQPGATPVVVPGEIQETMAPVGDLDAARARREQRERVGNGSGSIAAGVVAGNAKVRIAAR